MNKFIVSNLLLLFLAGIGPGQEDDASNLQFDDLKPPAHFKNVDWNKTFDTSSVSEQKTRLRMLQYNALVPWHKELSKFVSEQRMTNLRLRQFQTKMARLRTEISTDLNEKKKGLEIEIFLLKEVEMLYGFQLQAPSSPRGPSPISFDVEHLATVIRQRIERVEELAQLSLKLKQLKK